MKSKIKTSEHKTAKPKKATKLGKKLLKRSSKFGGGMGGIMMS
jgi:hypothetical protein